MSNVKVLTVNGILAAALALTGIQSVAAATLCVAPGGAAGCFAKINDAIAAASPNDTIQVAKGTYHEDVVIGMPISLIGADRNTTIIDALGLSNGVFVNGIANRGLANVVVKGFKVQNANFEGILVANASSVTIVSNWVTNNDKSLDLTTGSCPGIPSFETLEGFDCGEGMHLTGVDHSIVANNISETNAGGLLISDDTGRTHHNLIIGNILRNNPPDCGIVMASHPPAALTGSAVPLGVVHNTIANNSSVHNGYNPPGSGSGIGIFGATTGSTVSGNVVINNQLMNNGLPGIAFHSHASGQFLNDNMIAGNQFAGNGADGEDAATPGPTGINVFGVSPITGTIIAENAFQAEAYQVVVNTPAQVDVHLNNFFDISVGVDNLGAGTANAVENWWGCAAGPGTSGCANVGGSGVLFTPWLIQPFSPVTP